MKWRKKTIIEKCRQTEIKGGRKLSNTKSQGGGVEKSPRQLGEREVIRPFKKERKKNATHENSEEGTSKRIGTERDSALRWGKKLNPR